MSLKPTHLLSGLRRSLPLLMAQGVTFGVGIGLTAALLTILEKEDLAHFGRMREALRWITVVGLLGLPTGLLRFAAERKERRGDLLLTSWMSSGAVSVTVVAVVMLVPSIRALLMGDPVAEDGFLVFGWKTPFLAVFWVAISLAHATGRLGRRGALETVERLMVLAFSVGGAAIGGLPGLVLGSLIGSAVAAAVAVPVGLGQVRGGPRPRFSMDLLRDLLRVGRARTLVQALETLRPLVLLRVITMRAGDAADAETGLLYGAILLTLPLIAVPERVAQAVYPSMLDERGETPDLDRRSLRLMIEMAAVAVPLLALFGGVLSFALPLVKGGEYAGAVPAVWLLLSGVAAQGLAAHQGYVLLVRHRLPAEAAISALALFLTAGLGWILVPAHGATGAAAALAAGMILRAALVTLAARYRAG